MSNVFEIAGAVSVFRVERRGIPVCREWIGTLDGLVNAAIRTEVTGYLLSQNYVEGSFVRKDNSYIRDRSVELKTYPNRNTNDSALKLDSGMISAARSRTF